MKNLSKIFLLLVIAFTISCKKDNQESKFDKAKKITEFKNTKFSPTLENEIYKESNSIYCVTLLYAWNEITDEIGKPWGIDKKDNDLILLSKSNTYKNVLDKNEYFADVEIIDNNITAKAFFKKSLPFELKLNSYDKKLKFDNVPVKSFGVNGWDFEISDCVSILYYKNDDNFIIKLRPTDITHEIILFKTEENYKNLNEMNQSLLKLTDVSTEQKQNWRFNFLDDDIIIIPKFNFNIEKNYETMEGKILNGFENKFRIETAYQRTAFVLDENGAEIESEVEYAVEASESIGEIEKPKPKKLIFDKPFYVLLRKKGAENPYFALWNVNSELLVKE